MQLEFTQPPDVGDIRSDRRRGRLPELRDPAVRQPDASSRSAPPANRRRRGRRRSRTRPSTSRPRSRPEVRDRGHARSCGREIVGARVGSELTPQRASSPCCSRSSSRSSTWPSGSSGGSASPRSSPPGTTSSATLAFLAIMQLEVSLTVIAALLTVIGYSLNDTIIIFDRVREDLKKKRNDSLYDGRSTAPSTRRCRARC